MTKEEVNKMFGDVSLEFLSYYKYTFTFTETIFYLKDMYRIEAGFGGSSDDIYSFTVRVDDPSPFEEVDVWKFIKMVS